MKNLLKTIAILTVLATSTSSFSAEIKCITSKNSLLRAYPITAEGIALAADLKVKTCGGDRFLIAAKRNGHTVKLIKVSQEQMLNELSKN